MDTVQCSVGGVYEDTVQCGYGVDWVNKRKQLAAFLPSLATKQDTAYCPLHGGVEGGLRGGGSGEEMAA